jgi:succinate dehydrogenase flavin-adding protein (antitoxin of CptAB toxin-antitoxin module)
MSLSEQEVVEKILSFKYEELFDWIKARLHGDDRYFPIYEGYETNLSKFLSEAFHHIENQKFRDNFIEILDDLITELYGWAKDQVKEDKEYIYELLSLCGRIKNFERKSTLSRIARSGKLKGVHVYNKDLHLMLLRAMASFQVAGDYEFWVEQMYDESNKYYANAAFYGLLSRRFRLDILFEHIGVFINRFKGDVNLMLGISALINDYEKEEIVKRFQGIENILGQEQKEAVNNAFIEAGYDPVYQLDEVSESESKSWRVSSFLERIRSSPPRYEGVTPLEKDVIETLIVMGFDVKLKQKIAGYLIDIFAKKENSLEDEYEYWLCFCSTGENKVRKNKVQYLFPIKDAVWIELKKETGDYIDKRCKILIVSEKGFTKGAIEAAKVSGIELITLEQLISRGSDFMETHKKLIQTIDK